MWFEQPITGKSLPEGHLCFTFDDGPSAQTLEIARCLSERQIPAVFFVVGSQAVANRAILREVVSLGHTLGNHTLTHLRLTASTTSDERAIDEVHGVEELIASADAQTPVLFRAPYGAWNRRLAHVFTRDPRLRSETGPIQWDIDGQDHLCWRKRLNPDVCARGYVEAIDSMPNRSGIVLFHDGTAGTTHNPARNRTGEMIQILTPQLIERGYCFTGLERVVSAIGIEPIT